MEPIHVLRPPKEAFNKHRRVSDLVRKQVEHFKHIEHKLPAHERRHIPQHHIVTEDDAARYIAAMTRLLLSRATSPAAPTQAPPPTSPATVLPFPEQPAVVSLAASGAEGHKKSRKKPEKTARKPARGSSKGKKK